MWTLTVWLYQLQFSRSGRRLCIAHDCGGANFIDFHICQKVIIQGSLSRQKIV